MTQSLRIETIVSAPFSQNTFVVWRTNSSEAIIFDPGFDPAAIINLVHREGLKPVAIVNTHGHSDHIAGNAAMLKEFPDVPLLIGRNEAYLLTDPVANLSAKYGIALISPEATQLLDENERIELAGVSFLIREIPGHSPGSIVLIADTESPPIVLVGDVIFAGGVGRFDFPGGSSETLFEGIRTKLFDLPDETVLYPGHGPKTTVGVEKETNPYVSI